MYLKGRTVQAKQLAESIEFKPAKTLEEAIEFGKKNLGIKDYKGFKDSDVEALNWLNEGMTNVSNKMKGKLIIPDCVRVTNENATHYLSVSPDKKFFNVPEHTLRNPDKLIDEQLASLCEDNFVSVTNGKVMVAEELITDKSNIFSEKILKYKEGRMTSFAEKTDLFKNLENIRKHINTQLEYPIVYLKLFLNNDKVLKAAEANGLLTDIKKIEKLPTKEQTMLVLDYIDTLKLKFNLSPKSIYESIYHEFGHLQDMNPKKMQFSNYHFNGDESKYPQYLKDWFNDDKTIKTAASVSEYSTAGPAEFIAETFAGLIEGKNFPKEVMDLYKKFNGPVIPA